VLEDEIVELAGIPAPTFAEEARLAWIERRLAGAPGRRRRDGAGNLVWSWGEGRPRLLVMAHVDTVFPVETPLRFRREGSFLVGPGIGDNAAAVVVTIHVLEELLASCPLAPAAAAFTVGEEGLGNLRGARAVCEELAPEAAIAVEGHDLEKVIIDAVGSMRVRLRVTGPGGHSWVDRDLPSAIHALLRIGNELLSRSTRETPVNVGLVSGGRSVNAIAAEAELVAEMRALDDAPLDAFAELLAELSVPGPLTVSVETLGRRPAGRTPPDAPLLADVRRVRAELGLPDTSGDGSTDANAALALGIPALTLGVSCGSGMHSDEERIDAASLELGRRQLDEVLRRVLA
jgi:acetylornithine deacetylase/succinyl-diaminopimelate desuccinylase-like protein